MLAEEERRWLAEKGRKERAVVARAAVKARNPVKSDSEDASTPESEATSPPKPRAREQAAKSHNVSSRKVQQAEYVRKHAPKLAEKVTAGAGAYFFDAFFG